MKSWSLHYFHVGEKSSEDLGNENPGHHSQNCTERELKTSLRKKYRKNQKKIKSLALLRCSMNPVNTRRERLNSDRRNPMTKQLISYVLFFGACLCQADSDNFQFVAADHKPTTALCVAAATGDVDGLKDALRDLRQAPHQKHKTLINAVRCNGQHVAAFAKSYSAHETFDYLYRFTEKRYKEQIHVTGVEEIAGDDRELRNSIVRVAGN
jgi:hypothetical protein